MKISKKWLEDKYACGTGVVWFVEQKERNGLKVVQKLIKEDKLSWANWLIVRIMNYKQYVSYAVYAAEQVIDIYEKKYPNDKRPREAIKVAKKCIKDPSKKNKTAASAAASAASAAYAAASAAYAAASAAASAAYAAAYAAASASATYAAASAADVAARKAMRIKILNYGVKLLGVKC